MGMNMRMICRIRVDMRDHGYKFVIGLGRPRIGVITCLIRTRTCPIGDGKLSCTQNSLKSQFLIMICPNSSHLSLSRPQLYHHVNTQS